MGCGGGGGSRWDGTRVCLGVGNGVGVVSAGWRLRV